MTRQTYLNELRGHLRTAGVPDIEDIMEEYEEHFARKAADGYTEEETAAKLGAPKEIALQFAQAGEKKDGRGARRAVLGVGLAFADLFVGSFFILMFAWTLVLAAASVGAAAVGVGLIARTFVAIPLLSVVPMPAFGGILMGAAVAALGVLLADLAVYSWFLTKQMLRAYTRWHRNTLSDGKYPPVPVHPIMKDPLRRRLRSTAVVALTVFGSGFILGFIVLAAGAGSLGFWHVWHWFGGGVS